VLAHTVEQLRVRRTGEPGSTEAWFALVAARARQALPDLCDGLLEELAVRAHPVTAERPAELDPELLPFALG
jgi:hypothetical protein